MDLRFTDAEVRVLGCLIEKEMTTPDYYPLSLNALVNGCNQKSNREPVVSYDEETVMKTLDSLKGKGLVWQSDLSRVPKYAHSFLKTCNLVNKEAAILCVLFLRGPQTAGEIRERTERLYRFNSIEEAKEILQSLEEMGYVKLLPRQHGRKEPRYIHLFSDLPEPLSEDMPGHPIPQTREDDSEYELAARFGEELKRLRQEFEELKHEFMEFRKQF
ncbi:MAG: YceH family protein [Nitrospirae bacterium]|nr:YceH family protein [Nitrospirota bacterium]